MSFITIAMGVFGIWVILQLNIILIVFLLRYSNALKEIELEKHKCNDLVQEIETNVSDAIFGIDQCANFRRMIFSSCDERLFDCVSLKTYFGDRWETVLTSFENDDCHHHKFPVDFDHEPSCEKVLVGLEKGDRSILEFKCKKEGCVIQDDEDCQSATFFTKCDPEFDMEKDRASGLCRHKKQCCYYEPYRGKEGPCILYSDGTVKPWAF